MNDFLKQHKKNGFELPNDYMESFDKKLIQKLDLNPLTLSKESGFMVPQDYFDTLDASIKERVTPQARPKLIQLFSSTYIAYAAAIAVVIMLALNLSKEATPIDERLSSVEIGLLEEYLQEVVTDLSEEDLLLQLNLEHVPNVEFADVSEESMLHYLDEQLEDSFPLYQ